MGEILNGDVIASFWMTFMWAATAIVVSAAVWGIIRGIVGK